MFSNFVLNFLKFIGTTNGVSINMIILASGKGNAHNKSEVFGNFKWFDWHDNTQSDKNGAYKIWNFNHHSCAPEGYLWWFGKFFGKSTRDFLLAHIKKW